MWKPCEYSKSPAVNALLNIVNELQVLTEAVRAVSFLRDDLKKGVEVLCTWAAQTLQAPVQPPEEKCPPTTRTGERPLPPKQIHQWV